MRGPLTESELARLRGDVTNYVASTDPDAMLELGASMMSIQAALRIFKDLCRSGSAGNSSAGAADTHTLATAAAHSGRGRSQISAAGDQSTAASAPNKGVYALQEEAKKLRLQVRLSYCAPAC